jgi:WS/DGAT/MGAT family acyltransferase
MKQLSGLDATFLHLETAEMPMHVGALNVYELPLGHQGSFVAQLRRHMAERLPLIPVLRRRLWWMPLNLANPAWVDAAPDLAYHVVSVKLPKSARVGSGLPELEAAVGELHAQRLDRSRPLWRFYVLEGLAPTAEGCKRVGLYAQFHHAAVDGQAAVAVAQAILDVTPDGRDLMLRPSKRSKIFRFGVGQMLRGAIANEAMQVAGIIRNLPSTLGSLADAAGQALSHTALLRGKGKGGTVSNLNLAPRTMFNQSVTAQRSFAAVSLPLGQLKTLARAHDATLNDIVLLLCSTALRRYLSKHATLPRKSLIAAVPVSLRAKGDTTATTQASMSLVSLGTHIADLDKRLAHVKAATTSMKETMGSLKSVLPTDYPSIGVPWLLEAVTALYGRAKVAERIPQLANVTISNVPGPPVPLYLAGARMVCNYPTSIVMHGIALNITVESYDRQMDFGLVADAVAVPQLRALADAIQIAFDDLCLLEAPGGAAAKAAPGLVQTGRTVVSQARQRLVDGLSSMGDAVGGAVGGMVGNVVGGVVGGAVRGAVSQAVATATGVAASAGAKPGRKAAKPRPEPDPAPAAKPRRRPGAGA